MNPNWLGIISVILSFAAFFGAFWLTKSLPTKRKLLFFGLSTAAAVPGASFAAYYAHLLPVPTWYYQFRSLPGTELLIIFIGVAGGIAATLPPRRYLIVPLLGTAAFSIAPFIKPFIGPLSPHSLSDKWHEEVCMQSTRSTCGAASTATILKNLGMKITEAEIARDAHSYSGGTEAWHLARAIRSRGIKVTFKTSEHFNPKLDLPAIVGVRLGVIGHFIPIIEQNGDNFIIGDPMRGREELSRAALEERYEFTGFQMSVSSQPSRHK